MTNGQSQLTNGNHKMHQENVKVLWNRKVGPGYYRIGLNCHGKYKDAKPGQFIMLRFPGQITPFLRRPFSIHQLISDSGQTIGIEVLYKVVGEGTKKLSMVQTGGKVDIFGPLGNSFTFSDHYKIIYIVGGGIGVAPMVFLASYLRAKGFDVNKCKVFLGGRSKDDLLCRRAFLNMGMKVHVTTDDGSEGDQCFITHPLEIAAMETTPDVIYACGPLGMLKCVVGIAEKLAVPCQVSVETAMACGMGACLGCAVEKEGPADGYLHACLDGPVFDASIIKL